MILTQEIYEMCAFLNDCVYSELAYPSQLKLTKRIVKASGLRVEVFDLDQAIIIVICGTNSFKDWVTNVKVALGWTPHQHKQALAIVKEELMQACSVKKPLIVTGHSMGAGIMEYCLGNLGNSRYDKYMGVGFNGCGTKHLKGEVKEDKILNIVTSRDILNGITTRLPFKNYLQHYGELHVLKDRTTWNPVKSHGNFAVMMEHKVNCGNKENDIYGK